MTSAGPTGYGKGKGHIPQEERIYVLHLGGKIVLERARRDVGELWMSRRKRGSLKNSMKENVEEITIGRTL